MQNIKKLYVSNILTGIVFWYAIEKLFMQSLGIDSIGIAINGAVFLLITVLFDVPSGVLADKWKRKYTLALALACLAVSDFILGISHNFTTYLLGTAVFGFFYVLSSGTYQAMMYDSLVEIGEQKQYDKHQGRAFGSFLAGIVFSSLVGGYIAQYVGLRETFLLSIVPAILNVVLLLSTREPKFHKETFDNKFWAHIKGSVKVVTSQPAVFHLALFLVVGGMLRFTQNEFGSLFYLNLGLSAVAMGFANTGKWLSGALGHFIGPWVGRERAFNLMPLFFIFSLAFSLITHTSTLIFFFLASILFAISSNQTEATLQGMIPSGLRATTISLTTFSANILMIPLSLLFGWLTQHYSIFRGFQVFGVFGLCYLVVWFTKGRRPVMQATKQAYEPAVPLEIVK